MLNVETVHFSFILFLFSSVEGGDERRMIIEDPRRWLFQIQITSIGFEARNEAVWKYREFSNSFSLRVKEIRKRGIPRKVWTTVPRISFQRDIFVESEKKLSFAAFAVFYCKKVTTPSCEWHELPTVVRHAVGEQKPFCVVRARTMDVHTFIFFFLSFSFFLFLSFFLFPPRLCCYHGL